MAEAIEKRIEKNEVVTAFANEASFALAQRMAKPLALSQLVPDTFRGKLEDCIIALEMAQRIGASPLAVMQNIYLVHGKPAWSSQFLIACINASGKFSPLRYEMTGEAGKDSYGCRAWAYDATGEKLVSPEVTIKMAKAEGWFTKNGSKWQTMPELMLHYRAATLFARTYCPEITLGMQTSEEVIDITPDEPKATKKTRFEATPEPAPSNEDMPVQESASAEDGPEAELARTAKDKGLTLDDIRAFCTAYKQPFDAKRILAHADTILVSVENWKSQQSGGAK